MGFSRTNQPAVGAQIIVSDMLLRIHRDFIFAGKLPNRFERIPCFGGGNRSDVMTLWFSSGPSSIPLLGSFCTLKIRLSVTPANICYCNFSEFTLCRFLLTV
jgi:hypothetical protein